MKQSTIPRRLLTLCLAAGAALACTIAYDKTHAPESPPTHTEPSLAPARADIERATLFEFQVDGMRRVNGAL